MCVCVYVCVFSESHICFSEVHMETLGQAVELLSQVC